MQTLGQLLRSSLVAPVLLSLKTCGWVAEPQALDICQLRRSAKISFSSPKTETDPTRERMHDLQFPILTRTSVRNCKLLKKIVVSILPHILQATPGHLRKGLHQQDGLQGLLPALVVPTRLVILYCLQRTHKKLESVYTWLLLWPLFPRTRARAPIGCQIPP